ncbi:MAG: ABC transporter ATP-binding protein [Kiritimatiellia bacterium]
MEQTAPEEMGNGRIIRRLLALTWRYRAGCIKILLFQFALLGIVVVSLGLTGRGIDFIHAAVNPDVKAPSWPFGWVPPASWPPMGILCGIGGLILLLALTRALLTYHSNLTSVRVIQQGMVVHLRSLVYDRLQRLSFRYFDEKSSGTLITRVTGDVQQMRTFVDGVVLQTVILTASLATYFLYMIRIHVGLTLVSLAVMPIIAVSSIWFSRKVKPAYRRDRELVDKMVLDLNESIQGMHVIKGFSREEETAAQFDRANQAVWAQKNKIFWIVTVYTPSVEMLTRLTTVAVLAYGGWLCFQGRLPLGEGLIVFLGLLQRLTDQVNVLTNITDSVQQSLAASRRVFEVLDMEPEVKNVARPVAKPALSGRIRFNHVTFDYNPGTPVLSDLDLEIQPGQSIGILGTTGSGKSTLLSLIPRFYDVTSGSLLIDGEDVRNLDLSELRRQVGIVFQESFLFSNTVAANIAFGRPDASAAAIERVAQMAAAHDFISRMPHGYDSVLSEGGSNLSGGQRQRLAIARAILPDPPILLLDDPTAAVDAETEGEILCAIEGAKKGRTTFLVTHRLSALRRMDLILVMHKGRIEQCGTHAELLACRGPYRRAARIQLGEEFARLVPPLAGSAP